jgi:hypothetical protein
VISSTLKPSKAAFLSQVTVSGCLLSRLTWARSETISMDAKTGLLCRPQNPADLGRTVRTYFASDLYRNLEARRSLIRELAMSVGEILDGVLSMGACEINGLNRGQEKVKKKINKKLLAMAIDSDTNRGGASRGAISRTHENHRSLSVYSYFERFCRPALGGNLPVQRLPGERPIDTRSSSARRRHDHIASRNI